MLPLIYIPLLLRLQCPDILPVEENVEHHPTIYGTSRLEIFKVGRFHERSKSSTISRYFQQ